MSSETVTTPGPTRSGQGRALERADLVNRGQGGLARSTLGVRAATVLPACLIGLAAATVVFTRFIVMNQGMFEDEYYSVIHYITGGPAAIFGGYHYVPNDHMLFELLTWATSGLLGSHDDAVYRLWGVFPAIAAGAVMTWWLWRRLDPWTAAAFAILAAAAPNYYALSSQARGYGLGFLAGAMVTIGAERMLWQRSRSALALFAAGGLVGILTLPDFVLPFLCAAAVLALKPALRGTTIKAVIAVGVVSLAWYSPVLHSLITVSNQQFGSRLAWYGFVVSPLKDQIAPLLMMLFPGEVTANQAAVVAGVVIAIGAVALWRVPDRLLALLLIAPASFSYLVLEVSRRFVETRFVSFVTLPLMAAGAVGLVALARALARTPLLAALVVTLSVVASLLVLGKAFRYGAYEARVPLEATRQVSAMIAGTTPAWPVLSNTQRPLGFQYYLHFNRAIHVMSHPALVSQFCSGRRPFLYIDDTNHSTRADTSCLTARGAFEVNVPEQGNTVALWFVPALPGRSISSP